MNMNIARKQFIGLSITLVLTALFLLGISYYTLPIYYNQTQKQVLEIQYDQVVQELNNQSKEEMIATLERLDKKYDALFFSLSSRNGNPVYPSREALSLYKAEVEDKVEADMNEIGVWTETVTAKDGELFILSGQYIFPSLTNITQFLLTLYPFVTLIFLVLAGIAAFIYSRLSTKRIQILSTQTRRMQSLEPGLACDSRGRDEVSNLAKDINSLYNNLLTSIEHLEVEKQQVIEREKQKTEFFRMTSHELKTPIASMMGIVEGMMYGVGDFKDRDKYLRKCHDILQEQSKLVQSILEASKVTMLLQSDGATFSLKEMLEGFLPTYETLALIKQHQFAVSLEELSVTADKIYLEKALKNLLDNAFRYTPEGGKIDLTLTGNQLTIRNEIAQVLTEEQMKQIFQPFYRPDFSRNRQDGGTGLGLYIVDRILTRHQFEYEMYQENHCMIFCIRFSEQSAQE
ncbi:sensor histidine kinase [Streptococcus ruminantium]|uniref:sensor histidine kinase n=1 Tax=Streptococcus ruminantium TaxID=1917441 RepID=UPI0012DD1436|nr:HAMP domain-containing sensor histidine kinase [Streptococcus ruminantium]